MVEKEMDSKRTTIYNKMDLDNLKKLENWFLFEYPQRLLKIMRYEYLGLPSEETRYSLETEAYQKEQQIREIKGEKSLKKPKFSDLL